MGPGQDHARSVQDQQRQSVHEKGVVLL